MAQTFASGWYDLRHQQAAAHRASTHLRRNLGVRADPEASRGFGAARRLMLGRHSPRYKKS